MPLVRLTGPFYDGLTLHPAKTELFLELPPKSAVVIDAPRPQKAADLEEPELELDPDLESGADTLSSMSKKK